MSAPLGSEDYLPRNPSIGGVPNLIDSLASYLGALSDYIAARFELLGIEFKGSIKNLLIILTLVITGIGLLFFSYVFLVISLVFVVQWLTGWNWICISFGAAACHLLGLGTCGYLVSLRLKKRSFQTTLAEFREDQEWLSRKITHWSENNS
jgi:uncharacterized membrane protein YqjE